MANQAGDLAGGALWRVLGPGRAGPLRAAERRARVEVAFACAAQRYGADGEIFRCLAEPLGEPVTHVARQSVALCRGVDRDASDTAVHLVADEVVDIARFGGHDRRR